VIDVKWNIRLLHKQKYRRSQTNNLENKGMKGDKYNKVYVILLYTVTLMLHVSA